MVATAVATTAALVVALALALFAGAASGAFRTTTVLSGSMEPTLAVGDLAVLTPKPANQVAVGDVITYVPPGHDAPVTHRVVWIIDPDMLAEPTAGPVVRTAGDANPVADPWVAALDDSEVWSLRYVLPGVGTWLSWFDVGDLVGPLSIAVAFFLLRGWLAAIWRRPVELVAHLAEGARSRRRDPAPVPSRPERPRPVPASRVSDPSVLRRRIRRGRSSSARLVLQALVAIHHTARPRSSA